MQVWQLLYLLLLAIAVVGEDPQPLSCSQLAFQRIRFMLVDIVCDPVEQGSGLLKCEVKSESRNETRGYTFKILDRIPIGTMYCVGLRQMEYRHDSHHFVLDFNDGMAVGFFAIVSSSGVCERSVCVRNVFTIGPWRQFIESLEGFHEVNFLNPLYGPKLNWLRQMTVNCSSWSCQSGFTNDVLFNSSVHKVFFKDMNNDTTMVLVRNLPSVTELNIEMSQLLSFHNESFANMSSLETLVIGRNRLNGIPVVLGRLPVLRSLTIVGMSWLDPPINWTTHSIANIPPLPKLTRLALQSCQITDIDDSFNRLPQLEELDLSYNLLTHLKTHTFSKLRNLNFVDLSQNNLKDWPIIQGCSLHVLNLTHNSLTYIYNLGNNLTTVELLDISSNKISNWMENSLFSFPGPDITPENLVSLYPTSHYFGDRWTRRVNLSRNEITSFKLLMEDRVTGLKQLDIGGFEINCTSCAMMVLQQWLKGTTTTVTNMGTSDSLLCSSPAHFRGIPLLEVYFDEEHCRPPSSNVWPIVGTSVGVILMLVVIFGGLLYCFRSHIARNLYRTFANEPATSTARYRVNEPFVTDTDSSK